MTLEDIKAGEYVERYVPNQGSISVRVCKVGVKYLYIDRDRRAYDRKTGRSKDGHGAYLLTHREAMEREADASARKRLRAQGIDLKYEMPRWQVSLVERTLHPLLLEWEKVKET